MDDGGLGNGIGDHGHLDGAVSSSEEDDLLSDKVLLKRQEVADSLAFEFCLSGGVHLPGCELSHSDGDDDRVRFILVVLRLHDEFLVTVYDVDDLLVLTDLAVQGFCLCVELVGELPSLDVLVCGIVVDTLLGV